MAASRFPPLLRVLWLYGAAAASMCDMASPSGNLAHAKASTCSPARAPNPADYNQGFTPDFQTSDPQGFNTYFAEHYHMAMHNLAKYAPDTRAVDFPDAESCTTTSSYASAKLQVAPNLSSRHIVRRLA